MNIKPTASQIYKVLKKIDNFGKIGFDISCKPKTGDKNIDFYAKNELCFKYLEKEKLAYDNNTNTRKLKLDGELFLQNWKNILSRLELYIKDYPTLLGGLIGGIIGTLLTLVIGG